MVRVISLYKVITFLKPLTMPYGNTILLPTLWWHGGGKLLLTIQLVIILVLMPMFLLHPVKLVVLLLQLVLSWEMMARYMSLTIR